ncbi:hypothetical protein BGZ60DRAFT_425657 [Tricladium varicosporioides]|nr:hypothetical protein BGZ60DRAFT_425657 [Hymenoscyphus varicosporioides]
MFEHFTFGAQAQIQYEEEEAASPTDTSFPSPISPQSFPFQWEESSGVTGINDIVHKLSSSSLKHDESSQPSIWKDQLPTPEFNMDPFYEELSFISTTRGMATVQCRDLLQTPVPPPSKTGTVACRRMQRQLNVQLQNCSHHVRDINALVEDMIVHNSQCTLRKSASKPHLSSPPPSVGGRNELEIDMDFEGPDLTVDEDEGFAEDPILLMKEELSLRRACTPSGIRKHNGIRHKPSVESIGNGPVMINGRVKVRCVPRMRKRKVKPVPE